MKCPGCEETSISKTIDAHYGQCECGTIYFLHELKPGQTTFCNDQPAARNTYDLNQIRLQRVLLEIDTVESLIDFGCGEGQFVRQTRAQGIKITGIDHNTALQLHNFVDHTVDAIFMTEVIEHLPDVTKVLTEMERVLKPTGIIYIETCFADLIKEPAMDSYVSIDIGHVSILSYQGLLMAAQRAGLEPYKSIGPTVVLLKKIR